MGYLSWVLLHRLQVSREVQVVVLTGFLGGFTTFSAFSLETISMLESGSALRAIAYVLMKVILCIVMCFVGLWLAKQT